MSGNYERYNQALQQEKQLQQIEEDIRPEVEKQVSEISGVENTYNKNLRSAVISNKQVDLRAASQNKQSISKAKQDARAPLQQIRAEKTKLAQQKASVVKTFSQLESQGYTKEVRGNKVVYYKEDTYSRKKGDKRSFRKEEYVFSSDGTPIEIIKRDDYRDGDQRRVDEREVVRFDSQGRAQSVDTFRNGERDESIDYRFNSDGSMSVKTRDHEKEKQLKEEAQKKYEAKIKEQQKYTQINASVDMAGNSKYEETKFNEKTGQWEKTTTTYTKEQKIPSQKVSSEKVLQATKIPTTETLLTQNMYIKGGIPGVNQGTDTSNIQTYKINPVATQPKAVFGAPSESTKKIFTKEETIQMFNAAQRQIEYDEAGPVKKFFMKDWAAESQAQRDKFDASGGYDTTALTYEIGSGVIAGAQGAGQLVRGLVTSPIQTTTNIVTSIPNLPGAIAEKAKRNPGGLVGEVLFDVASGSLASKAFTTARNTLRPATIIDDAPASIRTMAVDDVIKTDAIGNFQIESGLFKRTKQDFSFESSGSLERVKSVDMPGDSGSNFKQITETRVERLSDKPSGTSQTPRQITQQSASRELADPFLRAEARAAATESVDLAATPTTKEIFRGEIETQIKNSKGEVVQTQKVPAELVRDGQTQTLFVNGKPFDLKQSIIETPKGIAIDDLGKGVVAMKEEGAFGLSNKQSTIETISTDAAGNQRVSLTQQKLNNNADVFGSKGDFTRPQQRLSYQRVDLLTDKPQTPFKFSESPGGPLTDPIFSAQKKSRSKRTGAQGAAATDAQLFEGVSMKLDADPFKITKEKSPTIIDSEITRERLNPKELTNQQLAIETGDIQFNREFEIKTKRPKLEDSAIREEREVAAVFGKDFVEKAKNTRRASADPFDTSEMFKGSSGSFDDMAQVFEQQTKQTTSNLDVSKPKSPGKKSGSTQESVMINEPKMKTSPSTSKVVNLDDISLDASLGADFSRVVPKQSARAGIMPSFDVGNAFSQSFGLGLAFDQAQSPRQGQSPAQSNGQAQGFKQDSKVIQEVVQDTGFKQINDQVVSQKTIQSNVFETPIIPPFAPPGFEVGVPPLRSSQSGKKIADPFALGSKKKQQFKGQYAGSLTGLVRGLKTPKDLDKLTGLEVRPIKIKRKF